MSDPTNPPDELTALREQLAAARAERERKLDAATQAEELDAARRELADEQAINAAIDEHGILGRDIVAVPTDFGTVIVKRPGALRWRRFQDSDNYKTEALEAFFLPCVVHPTQTELKAMLDKQPAILVRIGNAVTKLAGIRRDELKKD